MTRSLSGQEIAHRVNDALPDSVVEFNDTDVWVDPANLLEVCSLLKEKTDLDFAYLASLTVVDYIEYFELVYHLTSMRHNTSMILKSRTYGRSEPSVDSVYSVWTGADLQEREVWDLMGIRFDGHPNMKRVLLWEGFPGHPLRKDFLGQ